MKVNFKLPALRHWMPYAVAALCMGLIVMAFMTLLADHFEPESPQSAVVTAPSAQGFMGLRRVLEARGYVTVLNRYEDPARAETGDIEIITLDWNSPVLAANMPKFVRRDAEEASASSSSSSLSTSSSEASTSSAASSAASSASSSSSAAPVPQAAPRRIDSSYEWQRPDFDRVEQIHYAPRGRVVLLIAPKWQAGPTPKNPRWAMGPHLLWPNRAANIVSVATTLKYKPEKAAELTKEKAARDAEVAAKAAADAAKQGKKPPKPEPEPEESKTKKDEPDEWWAYEEPHEIVLTRDSDWRVDKTLTGALAGNVPQRSDDYEDDEDSEGEKKPVRIRYDGRSEFPLTHPVTLKPAPNQTLFASELPFGPVAGLQGLTSTNLVPVLLGPNGEPILSRVVFKANGIPSKSPVYVLSDPDILNNHALGDPQKLATALTIIDTLTPQPKAGAARRVVFDVTFNGMAYDRSLMHFLSRPPYIALPLGLLILSIGLMWAAFSRFGPPLETAKAAPMGRGVKVLADNAARLVAMAMRETRMGPLYAQMVRDSVLKARGGGALFGPQALSPDDLAERIGTLYGAKESYLALKKAAQNPLSVHTLVDTALRLRAWKHDILNNKTTP